MPDSPVNTPPAASASQRPSFRARIERIHDHSADTRSIFLGMAAGSAPRFVPGMFISISIPLAAENRVRPYTIASSPEDGEPFEICFNRVPGGAGVAWLFERRTGDLLDFTGPFGTFTLERAPEAEAVFIAESTAIAPIRPMIRRALATGQAHSFHLLYAADRPEHLLYRAEFERHAAAHPGFEFEVLIEGSPDRLHARVHAEIERRWVMTSAGRQRHFYICGVGKWVLQIRDLLRGSGYERRSVHYEQW
jgi:3-ketosteroid 9alpha-monooxygenase subunit B